MSDVREKPASSRSVVSPVAEIDLMTIDELRDAVRNSRLPNQASKSSKISQRSNPTNNSTSNMIYDVQVLPDGDDNEAAGGDDGDEGDDELLGK